MKDEFGTIEELCALTDALLCKVRPVHVLQERVFFDGIPAHDAAVLLFKTQERYKNSSLLECENSVDSIIHHICDRDTFRLRSSQLGHIHVFEMFSDLVDSILLQQNGQVLCRYTHILYWRRLIQSIGEDLPVTAMYVIKDLERGLPPRKQFAWDFTVRQNNEPLNQLLRQGISEHHMHLWASVPYFQVSWLNLMNDIAYSPYLQNCMRIDCEEWSLEQEQYLEQKQHLEQRQGHRKYAPLTTLCRQAALIRLYLCARLKGLSLRLTGWQNINQDRSKSAEEAAKKKAAKEAEQRAEAKENEKEEKEETEAVSGIIPPKDDDFMDEPEVVAETQAPVEPEFHFDAAADLNWPLQGNVVLNYSMDQTVYFATLEQYKYNPAVIIQAEVNTPVKAVSAGKVTSIETSAETGTTMTVDMGDGYSAIYGQLKESPKNQGDYVESGETLGYVSEPTKYYSVEGANLYFELRCNHLPYPLSW